MALSRKHYVAVAEILNDALRNHAGNERAETLVRGIAEDLASVFKRDNGMFDRQRFFDAVTDGTSAGRIIA